MPTNAFPHAPAAFLPFQDAVTCEAARNISRADFTKQPNPDFHRSFWLEGSYGPHGAHQWFIARLAAHGPITPLVPASLLQSVPSDYTVLRGPRTATFPHEHEPAQVCHGRPGKVVERGPLSEIADDVVASIT